ncbi:putative ribonuclease H protein [Sesbania bispinosa]|nr:putative ribonuclease H protein [Sesbania bispinosa]
MNSYVTGGALVSIEDMKVADLLDANTGQWRFHLLRTLLPAEDVENIIRINVPSVGGEDELIWKLSRDGRFSVKSAYYHVTENLMDNTHLKQPEDWRFIWRLQVQTGSGKKAYLQCCSGLYGSAGMKGSGREPQDQLLKLLTMHVRSCRIGTKGEGTL